MGILGALRNLGGGRQEESDLWNQPQSESEIEDILSRGERPQVIYKHSYSCAISLFAKSSLESDLELAADKADLHLIDVIAQRSLSDNIAEKTGVRHESPQLLVIHDGNVFWSASHGSVRIDELLDTLSELENPGE